jgi:UDP-glucose 4-epimerase
MKILVTGGAGFIGSHLVDSLIKKGYRVVVIDNLSTGKKKNVNEKAKFYRIEILDFKKIFQIFNKEKPKIVYHLAAQIDVRKSIQNPLENAKINILGSLNVIQAFVRAPGFKIKNKKFIFASSVGVYGEPKNLPIKETHPLNPLNPYALSKLTIENYLKFYQQKGLNFINKKG